MMHANCLASRRAAAAVADFEEVRSGDDAIAVEVEDGLPLL
jgi:hypothetical protein